MYLPPGPRMRGTDPQSASRPSTSSLQVPPQCNEVERVRAHNASRSVCAPWRYARARPQGVQGCARRDQNGVCVDALQFASFDEGVRLPALGRGWLGDAR